MQLLGIMQEKNFVLSSKIIKIAKKISLDFNDLLLLIYFENACVKILDVENICNSIYLTEVEALTSFNKLLGLNLIEMKTKKDADGRRLEVISLEPLYLQLIEETKELEKEKKKEDIYTVFETEFARPISSMEYEIINAWLEKGFAEELILSALKEAVYNGVNSLRYIDKILYEWQKKGYKGEADIKDNLMKRNEEKVSNLFDYNWLDDSVE